HIDQIPDVPIIHIFSFLSVGALVTQIPLVCRRWKILSEVACRARIKLGIHIGKPSHPEKRLQEGYAPGYDPPPNWAVQRIQSDWERSIGPLDTFYDLSAETVANSQVRAQIGQRFRNVKQLQFVHHETRSRDLLCHFAHLWYHQLTHL